MQFWAKIPNFFITRKYFVVFFENTDSKAWFYRKLSVLLFNAYFITFDLSIIKEKAIETSRIMAHNDIDSH